MGVACLHHVINVGCVLFQICIDLDRSRFEKKTRFIFLPRDDQAYIPVVQSAVLRLHVVRPSVHPSVTLVDQDHI